MGSSWHIAVSVIIPVYNVENFLDETISSVLNQELQDFEIILVDDGSTDSSAMLCEKYVSLDARVSFFSQQNSGVSVARNKGLQHAKGQYIYFLDSDDTIDPTFLSGSFNVAEQNTLDLVIVGEAYCNRASKLTAVPTCGLFIKQSLLQTYSDIRFPVGIQPCEDGLFSHQLFQVTGNIGFNSKAVYHYRKHEGQNHVRINQETARILKQIPEWLELLKKFYTQYDIFSLNAVKLALFIEHEPFELRYIKMPFTDSERASLFKLLKLFIHHHIKPYLKKEDEAILTVPFKYFMEAKSHQDFDDFYRIYREEMPKKMKKALFWIKFIPIPKIRRRLRQNIREKYVEI